MLCLSKLKALAVQKLVKFVFGKVENNEGKSQKMLVISIFSFSLNVSILAVILSLDSVEKD